MLVTDALAILADSQSGKDKYLEALDLLNELPEPTVADIDAIISAVRLNPAVCEQATRTIAALCERIVMKTELALLLLKTDCEYPIWLRLRAVHALGADRDPSFSVVWSLVNAFEIDDNISAQALDVLANTVGLYTANFSHDELERLMQKLQDVCVKRSFSHLQQSFTAAFVLLIAIYDNIPELRVKVVENLEALTTRGEVVLAGQAKLTLEHLGSEA